MVVMLFWGRPLVGADRHDRLSLHQNRARYETEAIAAALAEVRDDVAELRQRLPSSKPLSR
jgi:hypothetical protein